MHLQDKLSCIRAIVFDIDGVITNGTILVNGPSSEDLLRSVDAKDAFAARAAARKGYIMGVISGGETEALRSRCHTMGASLDNIYLGTRGKLAAFDKFCKANSLEPSEVAYFGDDIPDTQVLKACGLGVAPADAVEEAKQAADFVSSRPGGRGCLREGIELILKAQGQWQFDPDQFHIIY